MEPKITIRSYQKNDWPIILSWWKAENEIAPIETMMPLDSSFIANIDGQPALAVCLYLTNTPEITYVENFIGNPEFRGSVRNKATHILLDHINNFAAKLGYKRMLCFSEKPALQSYYEKIGFTRTLDGVATFVKETVCRQQR